MVIAWWTTAALAKSWCAAPLVVHEWGVAKLRADGAAASAEPLPSWFHRTPPSPASRPATTRDLVRHLPADSGVRTLPVVQIYSPGPTATSPSPSTWASPTATRSSGSPRSTTTAPDRRPGPPRPSRPAPPSPTRASTARRGVSSPSSAPIRPASSAGTRSSSEPKRPSGLNDAELPWVTALRKMDGALWVDAGDEADRFVFYEGSTRERPAVVVEPGDQGAPDKPHIVLRNVSDWTVHDVVLVAGGRAITVPAIPPGATAGFLLADPLDPRALRSWLRARWVDPRAPAPPSGWAWDHDDCVMMRDPAIPTDRSGGHRLYAAEVDLVLDLWLDRLTSDGPARLLYREDIRALDAAMPLAAFTDMRHYIELKRLGLVLVDGITIP